ncbi:restriction endonuclease subunit S [Paenibacillus spongiae]|uniref:Restriction endonuclease subunit S n=1 Tax=Paenibacillus spongiae TaxID=2909671 RepID=A0ABY5SE96_9BACL|nr:restriction endonuclease subunit S [Paenibacillus spongiae]UVI31008.1 restriction endonuclease subunit S [Paenibacillus spongiae]
MGLSKFKLGDLITLSELKNSANIYDLNALKGISIKKAFIDTKADMDGVSLTPYMVVKPDYFAYVTVTSRNGEKITIAHNESKETFIVSSSYNVFYVSRNDILLSDYLFIYFNRPEFDRYTRFNSWGSARETFSWEDMCDIEIDLPPLPIQQKYVNIYNAINQNQQTYDSGLEDLKLACDAYINELRRTLPHKAIGEYIELSDAKNADFQYGIDALRGVSINKVFIETKADMTGVSLKPYLLVEPDAFAYVTITSRNGEKISLAHNGSDETYIVSSSYIVFRINQKDKLIPSYLAMFFSRSEFDRYTRFNSWGSAREAFAWEDMFEVKIPIPDIEVQRSIVNIYNAYLTRRDIKEKLKAQIKDICPILIKGSLGEAKNA